jgi:hypothetical protein
MSEPYMRGEYLNLEEPTISNLRVEALGNFNPPITDLSLTLLIQVSPPRVTHHEHHIVLKEMIEANDATSSRSPHTLSMTSTIGGIPPPNPASPVWTTMVSTTSTLGSGRFHLWWRSLLRSHRV